MNTKTISLALKSMLPLVLFVWLPSTAAARNYEGSGTYEDPYLIKTEADFRAVVDEGYVNKYFRLENDLNLNGRSWSVLSALRSTIDGAGHTISNFTLSEAMFTSIAAGSKTTVNGNTVYNGRGELRNLIISNVTANFNNTNGGAVFTRSNNGSIVNCHVKSSTLSGYEYVAAIARACTINGVIDSCGVWSSTTISAKKHSGGLVAKLSNGTIRNSYFNGTINASAADYNEAKSLGEYGSDGIGAIVGYMERGTVAYCTAAGTINSNLSIVGGVIGRIYYKNAHVNNNLSATVLNMAAKNPYTTSYAYVGQLIGWLPIAASDGENTVEITNNHSWRVSSNNSGGKINMLGDPRGGYSIISSWDRTGYGYSYNDINRISIAPELQGKMFITCGTCVATDNTIYSPNWGYSIERSLGSQSDYNMYPDFRYNGPDAVLSSITLTKSGSNDITGVRSTNFNYLIIHNVTAYNGYTLSGMTTTPCSGTFANGSTWRLDLPTLTMYVKPGSDGVAGLDGVYEVVGGNALSQLITHAKIAPGTKKLGRSLFQSCHFLEDAELPEGLEELGDVSFNYCYNLKEIKLPSSLKTIGKYVFTGCTRLSNVNLGDATQLESIGDDAFTYCESLKELVIPASVKRIGSDAFEVGDGSVLEKITFMHTDQIPAEFERYDRETYIHSTAFRINKAVAIHTQNAEMAYQLLNLKAFARDVFPQATYYWDDSQSVYDENKYLQISTETDLHTFIAFIKGRGNTSIKATLLADFNMSGQNIAEPFKGTLDGNGHAISGLTQPLFPTINNASVCNLRLQGSINGGNTPYMGSLARIAKGSNAISKVVSEVSISSTIDAVVPQEYSGDPYRGPAYYGGLVGHVEEGATASFTDCLYRGALTGCVAAQAQDPKTTHFGGMVGLNDGTINLENCLTQPTSLSFDDYYATFAYGNAPTLTNCRFFDDVKHQDHVEEQGTRVSSSMSTNDLVTALGTSWGINEEDEAIVKLFTKVTWSGKGTAASPFTISSPEDLQLFIVKMTKGDTFKGKYVKLMDNLNLNKFTIQAFSKPYNADFDGFQGVFDGNNKTISDMTVNQGSVNNVGLIRKMDKGGVLKNLTICNPTLTGKNYVGTLVAQTNGGTIENCVVERAKVIAQGGQYGGILLGSVILDDENHVDGIQLTKNFYFDARCDANGVGTEDASIDVEGAEKSLSLFKEKNIAAITPASEGLLVRSDASILVPVRLQDFIVNVRPSIQKTESRNVEFSVTGATLDDVGDGQDNSDYFRLTPATDNNGALKMQADYSAIWSNYPYEIASPDDLLAIGTKVNIDGENYADSYFRLVKDIDMTNVEGFTPIGYGEGKHFDGTFDGNNHTIIGLHFADAESEQGIGLFGNLNGTVKNLNLLRPVFEGKNKVGAIAGNANSTDTQNIRGNFIVDATIKGQNEDNTLFGLVAGFSNVSFTDNYYHVQDSLTTAIMGSFPDDDAKEMFILKPSERMTLTNIRQTGKRVVNDSIYCLPEVDVTLDITYDPGTELGFLGRFSDGRGNEFTQIGGDDSNTWKFKIEARTITAEDEEATGIKSNYPNTVVVTPVKSTLTGYFGQGDNHENVTYLYDSSNKTLYFEGTGPMKSLPNISGQPWENWGKSGNVIDYIVVGEGITQIGDFNFVSTTAKSVSLPSTLTAIGNSAFRNMKSLEAITLPESLTTIGMYAFAYCTSLTSITLPDAVTRIGGYSFACCSELETLTLPENLTSIETYLIYNCNKLKTLTLPDAVTNIAQYAFANCSNLMSMAVLNSKAVPTIGSSILNKSNNCKIHVPNNLLASFKAVGKLSSYKSRISGYNFPANGVTVMATLAEPVVISSEGVTPAKVNVSAVIKQPVTVTFDQEQGHNFTFNKFSEKNPFVVLQAEGVSTKPAQGKTSVSVDGGNYTLNIYDQDSWGDYDNYYDDDLGVVYANNYKVTLTPQEGKVLMIDGTTSKDACNSFFVPKSVEEGLSVFTIDNDNDNSEYNPVTFVASAPCVAARDTTYYPVGTRFDLTYTPKKRVADGYGYVDGDEPMTENEFVAFRANHRNFNKSGQLYYTLSSAEIEYVDATHSTLYLSDQEANVIAERMNRNESQCDIVPEKGELFFHTAEPSGTGYNTIYQHDYHYFEDHGKGNTRWDKVAAIVNTIYFDEQITSIPDYCFSYMDRLSEVYFFGKDMPKFHGSAGTLYGATAGSKIALGHEDVIYLPEAGLNEWKNDATFNTLTHGQLDAIPAMSIDSLTASLTIEGKPCTIYKAAHGDTLEVSGGTYHITYDSHAARERVIPMLLDGGMELDDTENYSLRAFRVGDDEDIDGTDIYDLKDVGTYRLKIVGTRFHKGTIDLCDLVIDQAPFESITYETLPSRYLYPNDPPFTFEYGWMDSDNNYLYESPFLLNGEPLDVYHYGSIFGYYDGEVHYGDDEFELIYSDNNHVGQAGLTLKSRNHNFTEGEHTLYFTLYGDNYEGEWGDLAWDITQGVLTIKPKKGVTEAAMIEAEPVEGDYAGYNDLKVYPWFQTYFDNGFKNEHHNTILTINVCEGVTNIAADAFCDGEYADGWGSARYKNLKTIYLPESVHSIGDHAFDSQYVKNIVFAHTTGVPPLTNSNAFPTRDDCLIWVNGNLYSSAIVAENWVEHKDQIVTEYVDIDVTAAGMRTFSYPFPLDFTQQTALSGQTSPLKAYVATSKYDSDASELTFTSITDVPAATGLLLKGGEGTYRVPTHISDAIVQNNLLTAVLEDTEVEAAPCIWQEDTDGKWRDVYYVNFILANGNQGVGFYPLESDGTITANKAYLTLRKDKLPSNFTARGIKLIFDDGDQTQDIDSPETAIREMDSEVWYDLNGKRLSAKPTRSGLYIHNGKKIFVK